MLPYRFDPVEGCNRASHLSPTERLKEAIYAWVDAPEGSQEEHRAWTRLAHAAANWVLKRAK